MTESYNLTSMASVSARSSGLRRGRRSRGLAMRCDAQNRNRHHGRAGPQPGAHAWKAGPPCILFCGRCVPFSPPFSLRFVCPVELMALGYVILEPSCVLFSSRVSHWAGIICRGNSRNYQCCSTSPSAITDASISAQVHRRRSGC